MRKASPDRELDLPSVSGPPYTASRTLARKSCSDRIRNLLVLLYACRYSPSTSPIRRLLMVSPSLLACHRAAPFENVTRRSVRRSRGAKPETSRREASVSSVLHRVSTLLIWRSGRSAVDVGLLVSGGRVRAGEDPLFCFVVAVPLGTNPSDSEITQEAGDPPGDPEDQEG